MATDDESTQGPPQVPAPARASALGLPTPPSRLELTRELAALREALQERERWIVDLRRELEERDTTLSWREQEALATSAEAAAARRQATQFREDRDHARRQLQLKAEELATLSAALQAALFEAERLRNQNDERAAAAAELKAALESFEPATTPLQGPADPVERSDALAKAEAGLSEAQQAAARLAAELAGARARAAERETELLEGLAVQADDMALLRAEIDQLHEMLIAERRTADDRLDELRQKLEAARQSPAAAAEVLRLREELVRLEDRLTLGASPSGNQSGDESGSLLREP